MVKNKFKHYFLFYVYYLPRTTICCIYLYIYIYMIEFSVLVSILILIWIARVVEIQSMKLYYHPATTKRWELLNCPTFLHKIVFQCLRLLGWTLRCIQFVSGNFSIFALLSSRLHPGKPTWPSKTNHFKMYLLWKMVIFQQSPCQYIIEI